MKIRVEEVTREELVNLFSTATYGSNWLSIHTLKSERHLDPHMDEDDRCCEEKWADRLLAGGHIVCVDYYDEDEDDGKEYRVDLDMIYKGIELSIQRGNDWNDVQTGDGDIFNAENIIQYIIFGKLIYG